MITSPARTLARTLPTTLAACGLYALSAVPLTANAQADPYSRQIQDGDWYQLVFPVQTNSYSVADLLGDDLPASDYGTSWILFTYDADSGAYADPGINGRVPSGTAFWIMQRTGSTVTVDVPPDIEEDLGTISNACASPYGCAELTLDTSSSGSYEMVGAPFATEMAVSDVTVTSSSGGGCAPATGCDLADASTDGLVANEVLYYSAASGSYTSARIGDTLPSWQGFWTKSLEDNAGRNLQILLPDSRLCS